MAVCIQDAALRPARQGFCVPNAGRGAMVARRGLDFSAATSIAAGFGAVLHSCRAMQPQSAALDLGEKGVYPSYTHLHLADHLPVAHDHAGTGPPLVPVAAA